MMDLEANKSRIYYALYQGQVPVYDDEGNNTGAKRTGYSVPVPARLRVCPNKGEANAEPFGQSLDYDSIMITTEDLPIDEHSLVWVRKVPALEEDGFYPIDEASGEYITGHTHVVKMVAPDETDFGGLQGIQYAIKRVTAN